MKATQAAPALKWMRICCLIEIVTNEIDGTIGQIDRANEIEKTTTVMPPSTTLAKMTPTRLQANNGRNIEDADTRRDATDETRSEGIDGAIVAAAGPVPMPAAVGRKNRV